VGSIISVTSCTTADANAAMTANGGVVERAADWIFRGNSAATVPELPGPGQVVRQTAEVGNLFDSPLLPSPSDGAPPAGAHSRLQSLSFLMEMGFAESDSRSAIERFGGDVQQATEALLRGES
jgi:hypothetical protein